MGQIIDGKAMAAELRADLKRVKRDSEVSGISASARSRFNVRVNRRTLAAVAVCLFLVLLIAPAPRNWLLRMLSGLGPGRIRSVAVLPFAKVPFYCLHRLGRRAAMSRLWSKLRWKSGNPDTRSLILLRPRISNRNLDPSHRTKQ